MAQESNFSTEQVAEAIRAGLREGRQPVDLSPTEASHQSAVYRGILAHYREHVQKSLDEGDYLQAAEKSWGAYDQTIKAVAADHGLRVTHHASIIGAADQIALLVRSLDSAAGDALRHGLSTARSLHQHFYENDLSDVTVTADTHEVIAAINLLQELFPAEASAQ